MPNITAQFERCTFRVEAIQVTEANLEEIAAWCGGRVVDTPGYERGRRHVQIPTGQNGKGIGRAHVGNWVTCLAKANSFRVYKEKSFLEAFKSIMSDAERYAAVFELVMEVRNAQDIATYYEEGSAGVMLILEKNVRKICEMM